MERCRDLGGGAVGGTFRNHGVEEHVPDTLFPLGVTQQTTLDLCSEELLAVMCAMFFLDLSRQNGSLSSNECAWRCPQPT